MKKSFTLIEILIALIAGTILILTLYSVYVVNSKTYRTSVNQEELTQNARIALERMTRDIRQTFEVVTVLPPTATDQLNPPPSYIEFQDGHDISKIQYIKYYLDGNNLKRQAVHYSFSTDRNTWVKWNAQDQSGHAPDRIVDPTQDVIKADKVSSLKFYGDNVITVELTVSDSINTFNFQTDVWGRNI